MEIHVKISKKEKLVFKIRRYDDMFLTVKIFCEINQIDPKLIKPIILHLIKILNCIYSLYNINLTTNDINILNKENKIIRNLSQISYRLLNYILYSHFLESTS